MDPNRRGRQMGIFAKKMRSRNKYIVKEVPPRLLASRNFFEAIIMNRVNDNEIQFFVEIKAAAYPSAIAM